MAREWRELGKRSFPDQRFDCAWDVYQHAARLIIDRALTVTVAPSGPDAPPGLLSSDVADMLGAADEGAAAIAKAHMAFCLGATAFLDDLKVYEGGAALQALIEEANLGAPS